MNKKFSTLVASLLLSSAFSVYAGNAKPMLATPTQVETRATSADVEEAVELNVTATFNLGAYGNQVLKGFTNNARIYYLGTATTSASAPNFVVKAKNDTDPKLANYNSVWPDQAYWTLEGGQLTNNAGQVFALNGTGAEGKFMEIVPIKGTRYFAIATRANGKLQYVTYSTSFGLTTGANDYTSEIASAALFCSVETEYNNGIAGVTVNQETGNGFQMSISSAVKEDAVIEGVDNFAGVLTAVGSDGKPTSQVAADEYYRLRNAAGKYLVFDHNSKKTSDGVAELGEFKLVNSVDDANHYAYFNIRKADNGSESVIVKVNGDNSTQQGTEYYRLYIAHTLDTYVLSIADFYSANPAAAVENWAVTTFAHDLVVDLKSFLVGKFVNIDFVGSTNAALDNKYKVDGTLALVENSGTVEADFTKKANIYEKAPEAQWAVSYDNVSLYFTNRENPTKSAKVDKLYYTSTPGVYEVASNFGNLNTGDLIKISFVEDHSQTDGYAVFDANDLRNKTWNLGQVRQTADGDINVYWAENHGTHQIGATVEEENASKWNLSLVKKSIVNANHPEWSNQTDSVLIVSNLQTWNVEKNRIDTKKDTLVILPYAFQNRANNEFVKFGDGLKLDYYICDKDNKDNDFDVKYQADGETVDYYYRPAQRFALKMKADGSYNYIALNDRKSTDVYNTKNGAVLVVGANNTELVATKVYQENSTDKGTWREMAAYDGDANALMFVKEATAPEYRKLVSENGVDTVRIYRADNHSQVVYEKRDAKSVVDGRTLSFLNIDNETQFTEINPALYVDTAYVNRGNNTRYQYLLGVNVTEHKGYYCEDHGFAEERPCEHAVPVAYKTGRYLINMIDTANVYGANVNIHNNPYINETEEGLDCAKLSFVDAIHVLEDADATKTDKLYIINNADSKDKYTVIDLSTPDFNIAKFAFKYVDSMEGEEFKIQTLYKEYIAPLMEGATDADFRAAYANNGSLSSEEGYLRWVNGCLVVDKTYQKGDVFDMNEDETRTPTANEEITAEGSVVVAGVNGAVVVKGAEGKNVIVSTILGKVVANEVVSSDNATIAAPAGVVVVSVDGESFKVVVK